jgi:hypothetical protein
MSEGGKKRSSALEREVKGYLKPGTLALFCAYIGVNEMGKSEGLNVMIKRFFDTMPPEEKLRILNKDRNSY